MLGPLGIGSAGKVAVALSVAMPLASAITASTAFAPIPFAVFPMAEQPPVHLAPKPPREPLVLCEHTVYGNNFDFLLDPDDTTIVINSLHYYKKAEKKGNFKRYSTDRINQVRGASFPSFFATPS